MTTNSSLHMVICPNIYGPPDFDCISSVLQEKVGPSAVLSEAFQSSRLHHLQRLVSRVVRRLGNQLVQDNLFVVVDQYTLH